jgi:phage gp37-like protein
MLTDERRKEIEEYFRDRKMIMSRFAMYPSAIILWCERANKDLLSEIDRLQAGLNYREENIAKLVEEISRLNAELKARELRIDMYKCGNAPGV